jgi:hypothetical protein
MIEGEKIELFEIGEFCFKTRMNSVSCEDANLWIVASLDSFAIGNNEYRTLLKMTAGIILVSEEVVCSNKSCKYYH